MNLLKCEVEANKDAPKSEIFVCERCQQEETNVGRQNCGILWGCTVGIDKPHYLSIYSIVCWKFVAGHRIGSLEGAALSKSFLRLIDDTSRIPDG